MNIASNDRKCKNCVDLFLSKCLLVLQRLFLNLIGRLSCVKRLRPYRNQYMGVFQLIIMTIECNSILHKVDGIMESYQGLLGCNRFTQILRVDYQQAFPLVGTILYFSVSHDPCTNYMLKMCFSIHIFITRSICHPTPLRFTAWGGMEKVARY